jgi:phage repressor protein C with HTH and peptisase S24 domain
MGLERPRLEWMENRLKQIRRRPIDLAKHLDIAPPRVYELLSGKRKIQNDEMEPTAEFLEWPLQVITDLVSGKPPEEVVPLAGSAASVAELPRNIPIRAAAPLGNEREKFILGTTIVDHARRFPRLTGRTDVFGVLIQTDEMSPWRELGQLVMFEQNRPPREGDYVVIELNRLHNGPPAGFEAMIRLITRLNAKTVKVKQYNPLKEIDVLRTTIKRMYRVLPWEELIL